MELSAGAAMGKASGAVRSFGHDFREFLLKQNVVALAAGVIIGAAVGKVVSAIVDDVIMPVVGLVLPGGAEWRSAVLELGAGQSIKYGDLLGRLLDFVIVAAVVFMVLKAFVRPAAPAPAAPTKTCPQCLETIPQAARRCRACASEV